MSVLRLHAKCQDVVSVRIRDALARIKIKSLLVDRTCAHHDARSRAHNVNELGMLAEANQI